MSTAVILSTYNSPDLLELVLVGYAAQNDRDFSIVIADDGSTEATSARIDGLRSELGLEIDHVWHEDDGFRKCEILNRAIVESSAEYLIFSDGDCIPRSDFVATHHGLRRAGRFLSGGYFKLPQETSRRLSREDVASGRAFHPSFLAELGVRGFRRRRLAVGGGIARMFDGLTTTRPSWNGHNASGWRSDIERANGFDERMRYGGEDRELGERLENGGIAGLQMRHRAICLHLWHERGYVRDEHLRENEKIRRETARLQRVRTPYGIAATEKDAEPDAGAQA